MGEFLGKLMENGLSTVVVLVGALLFIGFLQILGKWLLRYIDHHVVGFNDARYKQFATLIEVIKWTLWVII
ncbi:MAG: hypothetical protein P1S60_18695, partial [Anaerolineae bacterium]|nr:hypothetical protein [Anaerolineae bacterium]